MSEQMIPTGAEDENALASPRLLCALDDAIGKLEALGRARSEPIAVVGIGCRFPGGSDNPTAFWRTLEEGVDTIGEIPRDRWDVDACYDSNPDALGRIYVRQGGFLEGIDKFDARFFEISPRETAAMDPQQRLLLEVAWEAIEDSGIAADGLCGSRTGVFVGMTTNDYGGLLGDDPRRIDAYYNTGNALNAAAGRVAHVFGFQGPSMAVDTACSSSLVAVHLACQSLRAGECDLALAGGVSLILSPKVMMAVCRARMLSPDGRCKTFDAAADGYGRGEGCGIVVLKRLSDALADGDTMLALIRGSAVNQDGASGGFTVPNGRAQEALIRRALACARVEPAEIDYLEAHGTGTALGDPIEVRAAANVLSERRPAGRPLILGSVKTNIGHLEAAAGVAGLIKVVLSLRHRLIPRHLHFRRPNPQMPWDEYPVTVADRNTPWPVGDRPRRAGVSSFGASGTNAHLIVGEAPPMGPTRRNDVDRPMHVLALSAKSVNGLDQLAGRYLEHLEANLGADWADVCHSAGTGRAHFRMRRAVVAVDAAQALGRLRAANTLRRPAPTGQPRIAFLFSGEGDWPRGAGRELYATQPTFRRAIDHCTEILQDMLDRPFREVLFDHGGSTCADSPDEHPALFALEHALCELWKSWGVTPSAVLGHGLGEYAAACSAGVLSLEDGLRLVVGRARLPARSDRDGAPAVMVADHERVASAIGEFERLARGVVHRPPELTLISCVTGEPAVEGMLTAEHWVRHTREPACFAAGIRALRRRGCDVFVEIGPDRTLLTLGRPCEPDVDAVWLPSLRRGFSDWPQLLRSLGRLYERGVAVDWHGFDRDYARTRTPVPLYPWQKRRHWLRTDDLAERGGDAAGGDSGTPPDLRRSQLSSLVAGLEQSGEFSAAERKLIPRILDALTQHDGLPALVDSDRELLYEVAWRERPSSSVRPPQDFLPSPRELCGPLRTSPTREDLGPRFEAYLRVMERLEDLSVPCVAAAWRKLGFDLRVGARFSLASLSDTLNVISTYDALIQRMAAILVEAGCLRRDGDEWQVAAEVEAVRLDERIAELWAECPEAWAEITIFGRCAAKLADVLRGEEDPLHLLFPEGDATIATGLYRDSPGARAMSGLVRDVVARAIEGLPPDRTLRVLELGAGTGGTTAAVLPVLPPGQTEYWFTDISPRFTTAARDTFGDYSFVRYHVLNIERSPLGQGFPTDQPFDLVIASNVLHATRDLRQSVAHARSLMAPGGYLVLLEHTEPGRAVDLTFGLTAGWWQFADHELRPSHPLISATRWRDLLDDNGYCDVESLSLPWEPQGVLTKQSVIVARAAVEAERTAEPTARWLIFADRGGIGALLGSMNEARGGNSTLVFADEKFERLEANAFLISADRSDDYRRLAEAIRPAELDEVVHLWSLDTPASGDLDIGALGAACRRSCGSALNLVQTLIELEPPRLRGTWFVTSGAVLAGDSSSVPGLAQSALWGLLRVTAREHPELTTNRIDLDPVSTAAESARAIWDEIALKSPEDEVAFRGGTCRVPRLTRPPPVLARGGRPRPVTFRSDASYLITGGLGGLGLLTARWMATRGAKSLVLVGRSRPDERTADQLSDLRQMGVSLEIVQADVARTADVARLMARIGSSLPPLRGLIHAAGVLDDGVIRQLTWDRFARVLDPKVAGAWNLHCLTQGIDLDFFILFSSFTAVLGTPGQANHAAANAFLDALAFDRRAHRLPALTINWGPWSMVGAAADRMVDERLKAQGAGTISPDQGLRLLAAVWHNLAAQVAVVAVDWSHANLCGARRPMFAEIAPRVARTTDREHDFLVRLSAAPPLKRRALLVDHVRDQVAKVLGLDATGAIEPLQGFFELGMDSLTSVELRNRLRGSLECALPATAAFDHPNAAALADYLLAQLDVELDRPSATAPPPAEANGVQSGARGLDGLSLAEIESLIDKELDVMSEPPSESMDRQR